MFYVSGQVLTEDGFIHAHLGIDGGRIVEFGEGESPEGARHRGIVVPAFINGHSHCADGGVALPAGIGLVEAVAPPDGLKHRHLQDAGDEALQASMSRFMEQGLSYGVSGIVDFREGGLHGVRLLSEISSPQQRTILGRPLSPHYDHEEVDALLDHCQGLGLSGASDMDPRYLESLADHVHRRGKILALHASEERREDIDLILSLEPSFLVHMSAAEGPDLSRVADEAVPVVICPRSNLFFGIVPPVQEMHERGVLTALGTDNAMTCSPDMRAEGECLLRLLKSQGSDASGLLDTCFNRVRKILNAKSDISDMLGEKVDLAIFPGDGRAPLADLFLRPRGLPALVLGNPPERRE